MYIFTYLCIFMHTLTHPCTHLQLQHINNTDFISGNDNYTFTYACSPMNHIDNINKHFDARSPWQPSGGMHS